MDAIISRIQEGVLGYTEQAKFNCLHSQLLPLQVLDSAVLEAIYSVPRERFLPDNLAGSAYIDEDIAIGDGRYLMDIGVFSRLVAALSIDDGDVVLDVGCGAGYSTAVIARLAAHVVAVEERRDLASKTRQNLKDIGGDGVIAGTEVLTTSLSAGCTLMSPYNAIIIEGGVEVIPAVFFDRLAEGGRMVTVEISTRRPGEVIGMGEAVMYCKRGGVISRRVLFDASAALLPGFEKKAEFVF